MTNGTVAPQQMSREEALLRASIDYVKGRRAEEPLEKIPAATPNSTSPEAGGEKNGSTVVEIDRPRRAPDVYRGISQVAKEISRDGISKDKKNSAQGYSFRGIDDIYNALSALLAGADLCILPRMISRSQEERSTARGGVLFYVTVQADFDFVSSRDGSQHTVTMYGEAMDSADKATNKAMSAAYKYACMQVFCIPTEGMADADATTATVSPKQTPAIINPKKQAAANVAERKIEGMQQGKSYEQVSIEEKARIEPPAEPARLPAWCMSMPKIRAHFAEMEKRMQPQAFHDILNACNVDSPAQFKTPKEAFACHQIMEGWIEAAASPDSFEHFEASEGEWQ